MAKSLLSLLLVSACVVFAVADLSFYMRMRCQSAQNFATTAQKACWDCLCFNRDNDPCKAVCFNMWTSNSNSNPNANANSNSNSNPNWNPSPNPYSNPSWNFNPNWNSNPNSNPGWNSNPNSNPGWNSNPNPNQNSNSNNANPSPSINPFLFD